MRILHLSDLHFGPPYVEAMGEAVLRAARELAPDLVVVSGDLTQRAKRGQYEEAAAFLERLPPVPRVVVPGNHDVPLYRIRERLFAPHALYREHIQPELDTVVEAAGAVIVGLDSTSPRGAIDNGRISRAQLGLCREVFAAADPAKLKVVVSHHHFAPAPDYDRSQVMRRAKRALDLFTALGVDLILGGHLHRAYVGNSLDVYPGRDRSHGIVIVQSGTATSQRGRAREREKNSFNVLEISHSTIEVIHMMCFEGVGFAPVGRHFFPRGPHGYFNELDDVRAVVDPG